MPVISIDTQDFLHTTTDRSQLAAVGGNMFGGILVNAHEGQASSFAASVGYLGLTNIRFPGGQLSEAGTIVGTEGSADMGSISGADQASWMRGAMASWDYAYDLRYPDLIHPAVLAADNDFMSLTETLALARAQGCSVEVILPTVRYTDFQRILAPAQEEGLLDRCTRDVSAFLTKLFVDQSYGATPAEVILDIGNENLIWTTRFPGDSLAPGQLFDPAAVKWGLGLYCDAARAMLSAVEDFRATHPDMAFKMAIQVPNMNDKPGTADPVDVFLAELRAMPASELAQIDIIRFHPLDYSLRYAADLENWMTGNLVKYAAVINAARLEMGVEGEVAFCADAHSQTGKDDGGAGDGTPEQSLQAAAATVAAMSSLVQMGVDYASAWGLAINYREDVQASYYDPVTGATQYTPRGEVLRQMAETLPGMTLLNSQGYVDAGRDGPVNMQAFGDGSAQVLFISANDINDGDQGETTAGEAVTIRLSGLSHPITYAWIETITTAKGNAGEAVVWNPLLDSTAREKGQAWVSFTDTSVTFRLSQDYQMVRLVVATDTSGSAAQHLIGDAQRGFGKVNDHLATGAGDDLVQGLSGSDTIYGGGGDDRLYGDRLYGGAAEGRGADSAVDRGDVILGGAGRDALYGGSGNDTLDGQSGADSIFGGDGDDVIYFEQGLDFVSGGNGFDTLILRPTAPGGLVHALAKQVAQTAYAGFERVIGSTGSDNITGDAARNTLNGGAGADDLSGWAGDDLLAGGLDQDRIWGGQGHDRLMGNEGNDSLMGGEGNDTIAGGRGVDTLLGGLGNDEFRFSFQKTGFPEVSADRIADFGTSRGNDDRISLDASSYSLGLAAGSLAEHNFRLATSTLDHSSGEVVIFRTSDNTLWVDTNGAARGGLTLIATLQPGAADLQAGDIFLF